MYTLHKYTLINYFNCSETVQGRRLQLNWMFSIFFQRFSSRISHLVCAVFTERYINVNELATTAVSATPVHALNLSLSQIDEALSVVFLETH